MDSENSTGPIDNIDLFLNEDEQAFINLGVMAAKIAFYNFQWVYTTLTVFLSAQSSYIVDVFLCRYNKSVAIKLGKFRPRHLSHIPQYVLFGEESSEITEYLNWLVEMNYDTGGKYLLICHSRDCQKCNETKVFGVLEKIYIVNAIFMRISDDNRPIIFTYKVIVPGTCKNNKPERLHLKNNCVNDSCFKLLYRENLQNLQECPLIVSTFEQPPFMYLHNGTGEPTGGDADMLKIVTSGLNATLIIKTPADSSGWGRYIGNNWTGSMGDVFNDRAHLSVCSLPLTSNNYGNFQISLIYNTMDIVWVAKLPDVKPSWEKLLHPFNFDARVSLFFTFVFIILVGIARTRTWKTARGSFNIDNTKQSVLFYSWVIFLGIPITRVPSRRAFLIVVYSWIWFCFIIRSCYQAALIYSLKKSIYQRNFESFYDFSQKMHPYGGQGSYREYFVNEKKIYDNWEVLSFQDAHEMLYKISNGSTSFVLAFNKEIVLEHLLKHNGTRQLQIIPEKIVNSPTVMYLRKYSPLAQPLNIVLSRAVEAGYAQAWHMRFARKRKTLFEHTENPDPKALNLKHFGGCVMVTVIGWGVSILFFIIEVYCGRMEEYDD